MSCSLKILRFSILLTLSFPSIVFAGMITVPVDPGGSAAVGLYSGLSQQQIFLERLTAENNANSVTFNIPLEIQRRATKVLVGKIKKGKATIIQSFDLSEGDRLDLLEPFSLPNFVPETGGDLGFLLTGNPEAFTGIAVDSSFVVDEGVSEGLPIAAFFQIDSAVDPFANPFADPFADPFNGPITVAESTSFAPLPVPEPPTISLFILGLLGLYGVVSFRKRSFRLKY